MSEYSDHEHDWLSSGYVFEWIARDRLRRGERLPKLKAIAALLPFDRDRELRVVDLGGGDGALLEQVLEEFPRSVGVLHDFSPPMIVTAKERLQRFSDRVGYLQSDMGDVAFRRGSAGPSTRSSRRSRSTISGTRTGFAPCTTRSSR